MNTQSNKSFADMGKEELRAACRLAAIAYGKLNNDGMRVALASKTSEASTPAHAEVSKLTVSENVKAYGMENCPKCETNLSNGVGQHLQDVNGKQIHHKSFEFECLACGHEFGPAITPEVPKAPAAAPLTTGLKIEKNREERNGVKRPSAGGMCRAVWDALDQMVAAGMEPTSKQIKELAIAKNWNQNNASIELYQWRKFNGIAGRKAKVETK